MTLLCQQASISIANALLFRSVQNATKANLQMISSQKAALEDARKSREAALKATKVYLVRIQPARKGTDFASDQEQFPGFDES